MRSKRAWLAAALGASLGLGVLPGAADEGSRVSGGKGLHPASIDRVAFGPQGELFIADNQGAALYAVQLAPTPNAAPGLKPVEGLDKTIAAMMGAGPADVFLTDLAIAPASGNAYVAALDGAGRSALFRIDGAGAVKPVALDEMTYSAVALPNVRPLVPGYRSPRADTVTSMAYDQGRLYVAGLSNEEFSSRLRAIPYPFRGAGAGAAVEVFHTSHGDFETRSPIYALLPMRFGDSAELLAAYLCTPLVRLKEGDLNDGAQVRGANIAEMGRHNRPLAMVRYSKDGEDWLLMANSRRGLLRLPVSAIQRAPVIPPESAIDTHDLGAHRVMTSEHVMQIALAGPSAFAALTRNMADGVDLKVAPLP